MVCLPIPPLPQLDENSPLRHAPSIEGKVHYSRSQKRIRRGNQPSSGCWQYRSRIQFVTKEATDLLKQALNLTAQERAELASSLIDSLDPIRDDDAEAAWQAEIARRLEDLRSGKIRTVPWDEVRNNARANLHE